MDEDEILLGVLSAVEADSRLTQRGVAQQLGIALGLANAYLKRCARKGLIKVQQIPRRRYAYYLTPTGLSEKTRLTARYLQVSFDFFRRARNDCTQLLAELRGLGHTRIALAGLSDLVDVMVLCSRDSAVEILGVADSEANGSLYLGLRVVKQLADVGPVTAVVVTDVETTQSTFDLYLRTLGPANVFAPRILKVARPDQVAEPSI